MRENEIKAFAQSLTRKTQFGISAVTITSCDKHCPAVKDFAKSGDNRARKSNHPLYGRVAKVACYCDIVFARYASCVNGALARSGSTSTYVRGDKECHYTHVEGWEGILGQSKKDPNTKYLLYSAPKKQVTIKVAYLLDGKPITKEELCNLGMVFSESYQKPSTQSEVNDSEVILTQTFHLENVQSLHHTPTDAIAEWERLTK